MGSRTGLRCVKLAGLFSLSSRAPAHPGSLMAPYCSPPPPPEALQKRHRMQFRLACPHENCIPRCLRQHRCELHGMCNLYVIPCAPPSPSSLGIGSSESPIWQVRGCMCRLHAGSLRSRRDTATSSSPKTLKFVSDGAGAFVEQHGAISPVPSHDGTECLKWDESLGSHKDHFKVRERGSKPLRATKTRCTLSPAGALEDGQSIRAFASCMLPDLLVLWRNTEIYVNSCAPCIHARK